jgi:DNA-binding NtrC family response regulator
MEPDRKTLQSIRDLARPWYDVLDAGTVSQARYSLQAHSDISVFITQHGEGGNDCIDLLEEVRENYPDVRRVVMTSYEDLARIVRGLHSGTIQRVVQKPINPTELQAAILPFEALSNTNLFQGEHKLAG